MNTPLCTNYLQRSTTKLMVFILRHQQNEPPLQVPSQDASTSLPSHSWYLQWILGSEKQVFWYLHFWRLLHCPPVKRFFWVSTSPDIPTPIYPNIRIEHGQNSFQPGPLVNQAHPYGQFTSGFPPVQSNNDALQAQYPLISAFTSGSGPSITILVLHKKCLLHWVNTTQHTAVLVGLPILSGILNFGTFYTHTFKNEKNMHGVVCISHTSHQQSQSKSSSLTKITWMVQPGVVNHHHFNIFLIKKDFLLDFYSSLSDCIFTIMSWSILFYVSFLKHK